LASRTEFRQVAALFGHELRRLLTGRAYWAMVLLLAPLAGYGYIEAVRLFGEASKHGVAFPELARGMAPLDGILVPTLGAFYLGTTLLFPFVAIRALGQDKESGALKLCLQWPASTGTLVAVKLLAVGAAWALSLVVPLSAVILWRFSGGHLAWAETANLFLGHALYALAVAGIAFFAAAITESAATAAILTLAFTLGFWVLDFAAGTGPEWLRTLGELSPTQVLKQFEHGLLSPPHALALGALGLGLAALAAVVVPPGLTPRRRLARGGGAALVLIAVLAVSPFIGGRASICLKTVATASTRPTRPRCCAWIRGSPSPLNLSPEDSRARELSWATCWASCGDWCPGSTCAGHEWHGAGPFDAAQGRALWLDRLRIRRPPRREPVEQPARNPAAAA
jgi:ABC-2 type transport system permease protein